MHSGEEDTLSVGIVFTVGDGLDPGRQGKCDAADSCEEVKS